MNTKTQNIYVKESVSIPLYVSGFTVSDSATMSISGNTTMGFTPRFVTYFTASLVGGTTLEFADPELVAVTYTLNTSASSGDCTGRQKDSTFSSIGEILYLGRDSVGINKSWIPFSITFGVTEGIYLISATLKVIAAETESLVVGSPCKIKVGFEKVVNPITPTTWAKLNSRIMSKNFFKDTDVSSWVEGEEYTFDVTDPAKDVLGADAITWTDGQILANLLLDYGSSTGSYRSIVSSEGSIANPDYSEPILELIYANTFYTDNILDTYIIHSKPTALNYNAKQILVGEPNNLSADPTRGLIFANVNILPATAIVTSASLCLYHESERSSNTRTMAVYRFLKNWDLYGVSWNKYHGTANWTTVGGFDASDCEAANIGSISLTSTESVGWKIIPLTAAKVTDWIDGSLANYGMMLKMDTETNDGHTFTSSRGLISTNHPKLIIAYTISGTPYTITLQS